MKKVIVGFILLVVAMALLCISVTIAFAEEEKPLDPNYSEPEYLSSYFGETLDAVSLPDGWSWKSPNSYVGNATETGNNFVAIFTPSSDDYRIVEKELLVYVKKAILRPGMISITNSGKAGQYIPAGTIKDDFPEEGYDFYFSLTEDGEYTKDFKIVNKTGEYKIYYKVMGDNVETYSGSITVNISGYTWLTAVIIVINVLAIGLATYNIILNHKINKKNKN